MFTKENQNRSFDCTKVKIIMLRNSRIKIIKNYYQPPVRIETERTLKIIDKLPIYK